MFKKILLATDGSASAQKSAEAAAEIAQKFEGQLLVLHVFNPVLAPAPMAGAAELPASYEQDTKRYSKNVQSEVEQQMNNLLSEYDVEYTMRWELGHPLERIVSVAQEEQTELIVMGSRGLGTFKSLLLGSISDGVVYHAHCPVLIVR